MARKAAVRRGRNKRKTYRCGHIMNCPARGPETFRENGKPRYRCMSCSLTMSA